MTPAQTLAASVRPLADVLVDRLRTANCPSPFARLRRRHDGDDGGHGGSPAAQAGPLLGAAEECAGGYEAPLKLLRPDEVAAAVLLGHGLDLSRGALRRLQGPTTVATIAVPDSDSVDLAGSSARVIAYGHAHAAFDQGGKSSRFNCDPHGCGSDRGDSGFDPHLTMEIAL